MIILITLTDVKFYTKSSEKCYFVKCQELARQSSKVKKYNETHPPRGVFLQRVPDEDEVFKARELTEVVKLSPLSDVVVRDVQHLQLGQTPDWF